MEGIEEYGYYAGIIYAVRTLRKLHPVVFENFEKCNLHQNIYETEHKEEEQFIPEEISVTILKHLKPLKGKWRNEKTMTDDEFKQLIINVKYLIDKNSVPIKITTVKLQSNIPIEFIRKTFYNLHRELFGKKIHDSWINFLHASFACFKHYEKTTTRKNFSVYKGNYEKDKSLIRF